jgi:Lon protease-like protein
MNRSRSAPRTPAEQASPVNVQNIHDAQLKAAFSRAISGVSTINALAPSRVAEVLALADADRAEDAIERLGVWLEQFRAVRATGALRVMGGTRG